MMNQPYIPTDQTPVTIIIPLRYCGWKDATQDCTRFSSAVVLGMSWCAYHAQKIHQSSVGVTFVSADNVVDEVPATQEVDE